MSRSWIFASLMSLLLLSLPLKAQTFEDGYQSYVRNQFPVAELQFKSALKKVNSDEERGYILKFIGICQYMRGDKKNAGNSFFQALNYDRSVVIEAEEVLDPSVVSFFNNIKTRMPPEPKRKPKTVAQAPAAQEAPSPQPQNAPPAKSKKKTKKKKESSLALQGEIVEERGRSVSLAHFLPFGLPQFTNRSYLLGSALAAGQAFAIYSVVDADKITKERQGLNTVVKNKEGLTDEQRNTFYGENNAYIDELKKQKNLALAGFGALWIISVAEGIINAKTTVSRTASDHPSFPEPTIAPMVQANRNGGSFGILFQTQIK